MTVAESVAEWLAAMTADDVPAEAAEAAQKLFLDVAGLCVAARRERYVTATLAATDAGTPAGTRSGGCTVLGHVGECDGFGAALVNGTAAHGEDYDDTFEGGPVHSGAVIVPAVLAA
jgi:2-methylcitrate dehydratase PrpD